MTALISLREEFNSREIRLSVNDLFVRVVSRALREHPAINASLTPEGIIQKRTVHIGIAVALEQGLIVPVIRNADTLTLPEIAAQSSDLIARARRGGRDPPPAVPAATSPPAACRGRRDSCGSSRRGCCRACGA